MTGLILIIFTSVFLNSTYSLAFEGYDQFRIAKAKKRLFMRASSENSAPVLSRGSFVCSNSPMDILDSFLSRFQNPLVKNILRFRVFIFEKYHSKSFLESLNFPPECNYSKWQILIFGLSFCCYKDFKVTKRTLELLGRVSIFSQQTQRRLDFDKGSAVTLNKDRCHFVQVPIPPHNFNSFVDACF